MTTEQAREELMEFLRNPQKTGPAVVVMPDFFLDRIINLPWAAAEFSAMLVEVTNRKGGSLDGIQQTDMSGGNAINVASALNSLGASVLPVICTSKYGLEQIKYYFRNRALDLSHVKTLGATSVTTALEFRQENGKSNVMVRDLGALADFSPKNLRESDYELIEQADFVCLFNWAGTLHHGTALAQAVFSHAKKGRCRTYYDTADPSPNAAGIPNLISKVLNSGQVDVFSCNENEAVTYACYLNPDFEEQRQKLGFAEAALEASRTLSKYFSARIDLHTTDFSATIKGKSEVVVPSFKVATLRATGAGDSWCAGNIYASYHGLSDECRLMLANAVAACYLSSAEGLHPNKTKLLSFLEVQR